MLPLLNASLTYRPKWQFMPAVATFCLLSLACGGDDDASETGSGPTRLPASIVTPVPLSTPDDGVVVASSRLTGLPAVGLEPVHVGLERMIGMYALPDDRWLITEKAGRIMLADPSGVRDRRARPAGGEATVFLDLTAKVQSDGDEQGLLGLALAPDYATSRIFYVHYSALDPHRNVISRFVANVDGQTASLDSETLILEVLRSDTTHNGGQLSFGPDGYLYIGLGDGGGVEDPQGNGQDPTTLLGAILRIDVSRDGQGYTVPPDNPFVGRDDARAEIWAYGFRNPWRFTFDRLTGDLWLGDVGEETREEVNLIVKGGNYGWNVMEGFECLRGGSSCQHAGLLTPLFDYGHDLGCAVIGGFVYRGTAIEGLQGAYVFADFCSGRIWALRADGREILESAEIGRARLAISSLAQGNDGELYLVPLFGVPAKIVPR